MYRRLLLAGWSPPEEVIKQRGPTCGPNALAIGLLALRSLGETVETRPAVCAKGAFDPGVHTHRKSLMHLARQALGLRTFGSVGIESLAQLADMAGCEAKTAAFDSYDSFVELCHRSSALDRPMIVVFDFSQRDLVGKHGGWHAHYGLVLGVRTNRKRELQLYVVEGHIHGKWVSAHDVYKSNQQMLKLQNHCELTITKPDGKSAHWLLPVGDMPHIPAGAAMPTHSFIYGGSLEASVGTVLFLVGAKKDLENPSDVVTHVVSKPKAAEVLRPALKALSVVDNVETETEMEACKP